MLAAAELLRRRFPVARPGGQPVHPVLPPGAGILGYTLEKRGRILRRAGVGKVLGFRIARRAHQGLYVTAGIEDELCVATKSGHRPITALPRGDVIGHPSDDVGVAGHLRIGDKSFVGAQAGVSKSVPDGATVTGTPARDLRSVRKAEAQVANLAKWIDRIRRLEKEVEDNEQAENR